MDFMFNVFPIFFVIIFVIVIGSFIVAAITGVKEWSHNNGQPKLTVNAKIVGKRQNVTHHNHNHGNNMAHHTTSTTYYVTFEVESGDRMELTVNGNEYGMLIEGDKGKLHFQGTRYLGFDRTF
jgi:hypothetical protein